MEERRTVKQVLAPLKEHVEDDHATDAELKAKTRIKDSEYRGFTKKPDTPLGEVLLARKARLARMPGQQN